jgi:hypothetical protein
MDDSGALAKELDATLEVKERLLAEQQKLAQELQVVLIQPLTLIFFIKPFLS